MLGHYCCYVCVVAMSVVSARQPPLSLFLSVPRSFVLSRFVFFFFCGIHFLAQTKCFVDGFFSAPSVAIWFFCSSVSSRGRNAQSKPNECNKSSKKELSKLQTIEVRDFFCVLFLAYLLVNTFNAIWLLCSNTLINIFLYLYPSFVRAYFWSPIECIFSIHVEKLFSFYAFEIKLKAHRWKFLAFLEHSSLLMLITVCIFVRPRQQFIRHWMEKYSNMQKYINANFNMAADRRCRDCCCQDLIKNA